MKILLIKTSSMGDVLHCLPAVEDAYRVYPNLSIDWVIEPAFEDIPTWHPAVNRVILCAWRTWRKHLWRHQHTLRQFIVALRAHEYDYVIDAQGLLKSAAISMFARGHRVGFSWRSARESLAASVYQKRIVVPKEQHAVLRQRLLFSQALGYCVDANILDYGLTSVSLPGSTLSDPYVVCVHATAWESKQYPIRFWQQLGERLADAKLTMCLPWGNDAEYVRAKQIAKGCKHTRILPKMTLGALAGVLQQARAVVAVDTGLGHMAAALNVPTVSLYGPTDPQLTGTYGQRQTHLSAAFHCAPCLKRHCQHPAVDGMMPACFTQITPDKIWTALTTIMEP